MDRVAEVIKALRGMHALSQGDLALALAVSRTTIKFWETGRYTPEGSNVDSLCRAFGISHDSWDAMVRGEASVGDVLVEAARAYESAPIRGGQVVPITSSAVIQSARGQALARRRPSQRGKP